MFRIIVCFLFILSIAPVNADFVTYTGMGPNYRGIQPQLNRQSYNNYYRTYNRPNRQFNNIYRHPNQNYAMYRNGLNALEKYALKKNYRNESELNRLERLELLTYGAIQQGNINERFQNVESAILSRPQESYQKGGIISKLGSFLTGQMTGFTPQVQPNFMPGYGPYGGYNFMTGPGFSNSTVESFSNGIFGSGYNITGNDYGGSSSVRILD